MSGRPRSDRSSSLRYSGHGQSSCSTRQASRGAVISSFWRSRSTTICFLCLTKAANSTAAQDLEARPRPLNEVGQRRDAAVWSRCSGVLRGSRRGPLRLVVGSHIVPSLKDVSITCRVLRVPPEAEHHHGHVLSPKRSASTPLYTPARFLPSGPVSMMCSSVYLLPRNRPVEDPLEECPHLPGHTAAGRAPAAGMCPLQ